MTQTKKFEVQLYYSSFCNHIIEAKNESEAIKKARRAKINDNEIMSNLEHWDDADTIEEIE